jgi:hypothetical protein
LPDEYEYEDNEEDEDNKEDNEINLEDITSDNFDN